MQYQWLENNNEIVIPDASIVCNTRDRRNVSLTGVPGMVEIYLFDDDGNGSVKPYLHKTVSDKNKEELKIIMFPNLSITFDELFRLD